MEESEGLHMLLGILPHWTHSKVQQVDLTQIGQRMDITSLSFSSLF